MTQRIVKSLGSLTGQCTAGGISNRARYHDGQLNILLLEHRFDCKHCRLGVEGIEDGLDQNEIRTAVDQSFYSLGIIGNQLIECDSAGARIIHINRNRRCFLIGTQHAGHKAGLLFCGSRVSTFPRQASCSNIQFVRIIRQLVLLQITGGGIKTVGFDNIGASLQIFVMNTANNCWLG